jgi:8-oxo-dGTP diphosphatase
MRDEKTFIQLLVEGTEDPCRIDDYIEKWHNASDTYRPISNFLGMTESEYAGFVDGTTNLEEIVHHRKLLRERYVVGLLFDYDKKYVVLIRKTHPEWQQGKLNGPGGHIEEMETPEEAMIREFQEETGYRVENWDEVVTMYNYSQYWEVTFFRSFGDVTKVRSMTDEEVQIHSAGSLPANIIKNLTWIIPLALDNTGTVVPLRVEDRGGN